MRNGEFGDAFQVLPASDRAGGVGGKIEHDHAGPWRDRGRKFLRLERKSILFGRFHRHGPTVGQHDARTVGNIAGFVKNHFVTGIEQRPQGQVDRLGNAHRHQHFGRRSVGDFEKLRDVAGDGFAQR